MIRIHLQQLDREYTTTVTAISSIKGLLHHLYHREFLKPDQSRNGPTIKSTTERDGVTTLVVTFGCWARRPGNSSVWMNDDEVVVTLSEVKEAVTI